MAKILKELKDILESDLELAEAFELLRTRGMTVEDYKMYLDSGRLETKRVESSNINQITFDGNYDGNTGNMLVEFKLGSVYEYENVPHDLFEQLVKADSVGSFFNINVKSKFKFRKVK